MHQPSILSFFGTSSSKKEVENNIKNFGKNKVTNKDPVTILNKTLKGTEAKRKRKNLIEYESNDNAINCDSNEINTEKTKSNNLKRRKTLLESDESNDELHNLAVLKEESNLDKKENSVKITEDSFIEDDYEPLINPSNYDPAKSSYHIIKDACWKAKENVPYLALTKTFETIESTTKRLEITKMLSNFFRSVIYLTPNDLLPCVYLCLNKVTPDYEGVEFGIGEAVIMKALVQSSDVSMEMLVSKLKEIGDLGKVAYNLSNTQKFLIQPTKLTVPSVYKKLKDIAFMSGKSAQTNKVDMIKGLLNASTKCEKKYLVRSLLGKLRIKLAEQTVLAALGQAVTLTPSNKVVKHSIDIESMKIHIDKNTSLIKSAFCECPNYNLLIESIIQNGVESLPKFCSISPGVPVKPMLAHPSKGVTEIFQRFDNNDFTCEYKYDGERTQIHVHKDKSNKYQVQIFSRSQEDNTMKYPDIVSLIREMMNESNITSCIIDSEAVAWDRETQTILPFQVLSTRKRKDVNEGDIKIQVCIYAFDLLYFNDESLIRKSFRERRKFLRENLFEKPGKFMLATSLDSCKTDEISEFLEQSVRDKCEGLMIKTLDKDATYEISKRSHNWLKLKKDYLDKIGDTVDLVVIGASYGTGKRASKFGSFLLACYDPESEMFQTICRLGTGLTDEDLDNFYLILKETVTKKPLMNIDYDKSFKPDCWFEPKYVWEIKAADLSISPDHRAAIGLVDNDKGISLRFPRFIKSREDKKPEHATNSRQIAEMYRNQDSIKNDLAAVNYFEDDEYY